jgi:hypothetical protein
VTTGITLCIGRNQHQADLPTGQVIDLDSILKRNAEFERIQSATDKLSSKCELTQECVKQIREEFLRNLYLQNLMPRDWHVMAIAIVERIIGAEFEKLEKKINQVLFVCSRFHFAEPPQPDVLARYNVTERIPEWIESAPLTPSSHTMGDITEYLYNRLGKTIIELLCRPDCNIEIFIGPKDDLLDFYHSFTPALFMKGEIDSPTSTEFYLFENSERKPTTVITNISNQSRFHHQLWQFKYAGIDLKRIKIRGTFEIAIRPQTTLLRLELRKLPVKPRIAILGQRWSPMEILGKLGGIRGIEGGAYDSIRPTQFQIGPFVFDYVVADVAGAPDWRSKIGIVAFRMPNGSLAAEAVAALVETGTMYLLLAGAGGSLDPEAVIGSYQIFRHASLAGRKYSVSEASFFLPNLPGGFPLVEDGLNITVDSPLEETREWLERCRSKGFSIVDVESAHIVKALIKSAKGSQVKLTPGLFISDVVGMKPLTEKINGGEAYAQLDQLLKSYFLSVGVAGVYDAEGDLHRFSSSGIAVNPALIDGAQSTRDVTRRKVMGVRIRADEFRIVSRQRKKVGYPDFRSMMGHKHILFVVPPDEAEVMAYETFLSNVDPERLFLVFPTNESQAAIDMARERGFETIVIVEPSISDAPKADYLIARDTGWGTYETVAASNSHAIVIFGDPKPMKSLILKMDNENRSVFILDRWSHEAFLDELDDCEFFAPQQLTKLVDQKIKLRRLEKWVSRVRPDIDLIKLSCIQEYARGRTIIGVSGSSKITQFDPVSTETAFRILLKLLQPEKIMFATGGTDYGVEKILHHLIRDDFPDFGLIGFITNESKGEDLGVPALTVAGNDWFGKSVPFLNSIDFFVTVAGGGVIRQELLMAHKAAIPTFPLAGSGMSTEEFLEEHPELPRYYTGEEIAKAIGAIRKDLLLENVSI